MKYKNICVLIPFFENGLKNWHKLSIKGTVNTHGVHREIKRFCRREYKINPDPIFLNHECIYYQPFEKNKEDKFRVERLAKTAFTVLQDEHEQIIADTETQSEITTGAKEHLPPL